jgi:chromate reductase
MSKVLMIAMSLRKDSFNKKLIRNAYDVLKASSEDIELLSLNDFPIPMYDGDEETNKGIPASVTALGERISKARAIVISTPEYNGSIPGTFKNLIDWVSRIKPMPWNGKHILLLGASPGALGAVRGLWHSRVPLEACGCFVYPEMFGLSKAAEAFNENGTFSDQKNLERLTKLLTQFSTHVGN